MTCDSITSLLALAEDAQAALFSVHDSHENSNVNSLLGRSGKAKSFFSKKNKGIMFT